MEAAQLCNARIAARLHARRQAAQMLSCQWQMAAHTDTCHSRCPGIPSSTQHPPPRLLHVCGVSAPELQQPVRFADWCEVAARNKGLLPSPKKPNKVQMSLRSLGRSGG